MTAHEKRALFVDATYKLKCAAQFADAMSGETVTKEVAITMMQLTATANSAVIILYAALSNPNAPSPPG